MKKKKKKQRILFEMVAMTSQKAVDNVPVRQIEGLHVEATWRRGRLLKTLGEAMRKDMPFL